ncbi:hypothetical protein V6N12_000342 [Hibiscus sabdariffa]|uniref:RNase H type-1 domain-containing protein n=1 Tax=Hibiscus sabdariffa TaxID=183260 RepID=A0ABR2B4W2_9ROSI
MAIENDWTQVVFEGDSATVVSKLNQKELDRSHTVAHLRSTISKLVDHPGFSFSFVRRASSFSLMGVCTDQALTAINELKDGLGSRWCESRVRRTSGRRMVRLGCLVRDLGSVSPPLLGFGTKHTAEVEAMGVKGNTDGHGLVKVGSYDRGTKVFVEMYDSDGSGILLENRTRLIESQGRGSSEMEKEWRFSQVAGRGSASENRGWREGRDSGWEEKRWWRRKMMRKRRVENGEQWFQKRRKRRIGSTKGTGPNMHAWKGKRIGGLSCWLAGPKGDDTFGGLRFARELVQNLGEQNQSSGPSIICHDSGRHHNDIGLTMDQWRISNAMQSVFRWFLMRSGLRECMKWIIVIQGWANNYAMGFAWLMKAGLRKRVSMQRKQRDRGGKKEEPEFKLMADRVTKLMEKLKFSEEELMEVGEMEGTQLGNVDGSKKWLVLE